MYDARLTGPVPPPKPVWEWWRFPAPGCGVFAAVLALSAVLAATVSPLFWAAVAALVAVFLVLRGLVRNDCGT